MGEIIKKVVGDFSTDPDYNDFTIEWNSDKKAHIHHKNIRLDLNVDDYNSFYEAVISAHKKLNG
jgi:hypothetical protein